VRGGGVDDAVDLDRAEAEGGARDREPVGEVDPAEPLSSVPDRAAEAGAGEQGESVEGGAVERQDDARAQDREVLGVGALDGGLPGVRDAGHLGQCVGAGRERRGLVHQALPGVGPDCGRARLEPVRDGGGRLMAGLHERPGGIDSGGP